MDRVAFLVEDSGEMIECLLNPEKLQWQRNSGITDVQSVHGTLSGIGLSDSPLLFTGGGSTEIELQLLFDINLQSSKPLPKDVRKLTEPLWNLTKPNNQRRTPAIVCFIWGKSMNVKGVVLDLAERLEHFTVAGIPQRSWISLRFRKVDVPLKKKATAAPLNIKNHTSSQKGKSSTQQTVKSHRLSGGILPASLTDNETANKQPSLDELVDKMLLDSGLGIHINHSLDAAKALLDQFRTALAFDFSSESQDNSDEKKSSLKTSWQNLQDTLTLVSHATGAFLLDQYSGVKDHLNTFARRVATLYQKHVDPVLTKAWETMKPLLNMLKQQAKTAWAMSKETYRRLKEKVVQAVVTGTQFMQQAYNAIKPFAKKAQHSLGGAIDTTYQHIKKALKTAFEAMKLIAHKTIEHLIEPLYAQLKQLPPLLAKAWEKGKTQVVKQGRWLLDTILHGIQYLQTASESFRFIRQQSPLEQALTRTQQLENKYAQPQAEHKVADTKKYIEHITGNILELPEKPEVKILIKDLKILQAWSVDNSIEHHKKLTQLQHIKAQLKTLQSDEQQQQENDLESVIQKNNTGKSQPSNRYTSNSERLDQVAYHYYQDASLWRRIAYANDVIDPLKLPSNLALKIP
ncbi:MAG: Unknown protein [uncultured Thiotrichaceae bacterium]|uniref:Contractile injection system tube protein N-terminal domain-containing protein n=1 Tax=uncultured Thiotrichaceae bacterium TaxID=298394 RepID=A0A6S6SM99_9GAMM|nr:MAG: Unknown protein [uncultured Thiotrichaceae bacterium]